VSPEAGQLKQDPTFFDSSRPSGEARLADMLEESAFWSGSLMKICSHRMWAVFIGYFGLAIVLLIVVVEFGNASAAQKIAELFCVVITFLMSTDVLGAARKFGSGASGLETMLPRVEAVQVRGERRGDLLLLLLDYNSIVEGVPVIPDRVYLKQRDRLNKLWSLRKRA
jgi:hypothetical protein